jgi:hypothetical protein
MLSIIYPQSNDLHIYFEPEELQQLQSGTVQGTHINHDNPEILGTLEAVVVDGFRMDQVQTHSVREAQRVTEMYLEIRRGVYNRLRTRGRTELHEGWRHINLIDISKLDEMGQVQYVTLREYVQ